MVSFSRRLCLLLLLFLACGAYFNALENGFLWDDEHLVVTNSYIRNSTYLGKIFLSDLRHGEIPSNFYRPLLTASFMMDYYLWGQNPAGYHATNIALHTLAAFLLFALMQQLNLSVRTSFLIAALFLVHPVNTEAVTYIAGRSDPLLVVFGLIALLCFHESYRTETRKKEILWQCAALLAFVGALFTREIALILPLLMLWWIFVLRVRLSSKGIWWLPILPFIVVTLVYLLWRSWVLRSVGIEMVWGGAPLTTRMILSLRSLAVYAGLLLCPIHLQMERQVFFGGASLHVLTAIGSMLVLLWCGAIAFARTRSRPVFLGLGWCGITYLPISGLIPINASLAEHWLYLPSIGFYLAAVVAISEWISKLRLERPWVDSIAWMAACLILTAFAARTFVRNRDWRDAKTFFAVTQRDAPRSGRTGNNLALQSIREGDFKTAQTILSNALQLPGAALVKSNLLTNAGDLFTKANQLENAFKCYSVAIELYPRNSTPYFRRASLNEKLRDLPAAESDLRRIVELCPRSTSAHTQLIQFYLRHHRWPDARLAAEMALQMEPGNANFYNLLGNALYAEGKINDAQSEYERATTLDRHSPHNWVDLGLLHAEQKRFQDAERSLLRATNIAPRDPDIHLSLAIFYWKLEKWDLASRAVEQTLAMAPKHKLATSIRAAIRAKRSFESISQPARPNTAIDPLP